MARKAGQVQQAEEALREVDTAETQRKEGGTFFIWRYADETDPLSTLKTLLLKNWDWNTLTVPAGMAHIAANHLQAPQASPHKPAQKKKISGAEAIAYWDKNDLQSIYSDREGSSQDIARELREEAQTRDWSDE